MVALPRQKIIAEQGENSKSRPERSAAPGSPRRGQVRAGEWPAPSGCARTSASGGRAGRGPLPGIFFHVLASIDRF